MNETSKIIALLPMKAHSERVRGKNFRPLHGKPLCKWMLDVLTDVSEISQVVINTDARSLLQEKGIYSSDKIFIRDRRPEICGDSVSMNLIIEDDMENIKSDIYLMTHTTNPLLTSKTILSALETFKEARERGEADSLFTVNRFQTRFYREDCSAVNHDPDNLIRTQDLEAWYEENSLLYIFTAESFSRNNARIGKSPIMFETPQLESIDIDEPSDWEMAEAMAQYLYPTNK